MSEFIPRPEFNAAVDSIRREIHAMGEHLGKQLAIISSQLSEMRKETGKVAVLEVRVESLEEKDRSKQSMNRTLAVGLIISLVGHLLPFLLKR